jgi:hypothetical protein
MRNAGILQQYNDNYLKDYIGNHYEVISYTPPEEDTYVNIYRGNRLHKKVYVRDSYGNLLSIPQSIMVATTIKDIEEHQKNIII